MSRTQNDAIAYVIVFGLLFTIIGAIIHFINWLLVKGIIFIAHELFNVNWYGKFWAVYIAIFIIGFLFRGFFKIKIKS